MRELLTPLLVTVLALPAEPLVGLQEPDLTTGIRQVEEGDLETAIVTLDAVISKLSRVKGREKDLAMAHLYMAMAHIGLNQLERAKASVREAWKSNRDLTVDPARFPPAILGYFEEAKNDGETNFTAQQAASPSPSPSQGRWMAPPETKRLQNPVKPDGQTVERGRQVYLRYCVACHGVNGVGDGKMATTLGYKPANLSLEPIQQQTDGEIFWKISKGRSPMPDWEKQMSARERWHVVSYVRTLLRPTR